MEALSSHEGLTLQLSLLYFVVMVAARWHRVACPTRELLSAQIAALKSDTGKLFHGDEKGPTSTYLCSLLVAAENTLGIPRKQPGSILPRRPRLADVVFWSRGKENSGWDLVHKVEVQLVEHRDGAFVQARLEYMEALLRQTNETPIVELAERIRLELAHSSTGINLVRCKALLAEALAAYYRRTDHLYSDLRDWQNKSSWLVSCGLILIVALVWAFPEHAILFLLGAVGGLLSRLSRTLTSKDLPTDYGASWTTLFLSPVSGALGGWIGVLVAGLLVRLHILDGSLEVVWDKPLGALAMGIAVIFGFSERLLSSVLDTVGIKEEELKRATANTFQPVSKAPFQITVGPRLVEGTVGQPYGPVALTTSGASGGVLWKRAAGSVDLPTGLRIEGDTIQGTPMKAVEKGSFWIEAADETRKTQKRMNITISEPREEPPVDIP